MLRSDNPGQPALIADHLTPLAPDPGYDDGEGQVAGDRPGAGLKERTRQRGEEQSRSVSDEEDMPPMYSRASGALRLQVDALDYYGLWKLFDALCDAAFHGRNRNFALGNTLQQRFMGYWNDGKPVKQLLATDHP